MKTTRILAISILALVVGLPAGVAKADGDPRPSITVSDPRPTISTADGAEWVDVRYDDEAHCLIDCYLDSNGDTWLLCWDYVLDDVVCCRATGNKEISVGGGGGVPTESVGGGGGVPTESVGTADAADCFLNIDGVPGESTYEGHADWIEVMSFSHGVSQPGGGSTGPTATTGRCDVQDMSITKELDKASATLNTQTDRQTGEAMPWGWLEQMRPRKDPRIETFPLPE